MSLQAENLVTKEELDSFLAEVKVGQAQVRKDTRVVAVALDAHIATMNSGAAELTKAVKGLTNQVGDTEQAIIQLGVRVGSVEALTDAIQDIAAFGRVTGKLLKWVSILGIIISAGVAIYLGFPR